MAGAGEETTEFSFRTRAAALRRFSGEVFDLLIVGGGITGAAVARDAASRGLRVALVEKSDFASGTSSRSSKLIHGGLRYLQNLELGLVFEALAERSLLLRAAPHLVRPLRFYLPVYQGDPHGRALLSLGLWLYDLLALFRAPGFHRRLSARGLLAAIPILQPEKLVGGFQYYDASMWDDAMVVETARSASELGAAIATFCEATEPLWEGERVTGFRLRDRSDPSAPALEVRGRRVVICAGPWTDQLGERLGGARWRNWLSPSKGVHLVFDHTRIPIPGALVMSHPSDGRISFVIPRPDFGAGVVIVGTTDGPTPPEPEKAAVESGDVEYLLELLRRYFPAQELKRSDILSAYVGVRPLMGPVAGHWAGQELQGVETGPGPAPPPRLQKVSREHHIGLGPGGTTVVAGGKYTTHRRMATEIVDFTLKEWTKAAKHGAVPAVPGTTLGRRPATEPPINPRATHAAMEQARQEAARRGIKLPEPLVQRYGLDALIIQELDVEGRAGGESLPTDPPGFPCLVGQLRFAIRRELVVSLVDFYLRRCALYASRADHGLPWAAYLARVWARELGFGEERAREELRRLGDKVAELSAWSENGRMK